MKKYFEDDEDLDEDVDDDEDHDGEDSWNEDEE